VRYDLTEEEEDELGLDWGWDPDEPSDFSDLSDDELEEESASVKQRNDEPAAE
jgi:hypothetical protein